MADPQQMVIQSTNKVSIRPSPHHGRRERWTNPSPLSSSSKCSAPWIISYLNIISLIISPSHATVTKQRWQTQMIRRASQTKCVTEVGGSGKKREWWIRLKLTFESYFTSNKKQKSSFSGNIRKPDSTGPIFSCCNHHLVVTNGGP